MKIVIFLSLLFFLKPTFTQDASDFFKTESIDFENECARGLPEKVIDQSIYKTNFKIENFVGFETVQIDSESTLIIKNHGCESYVLTFRFEVPEKRDKKNDVTRWYKRLVFYLSKIKEANTSPINLEKLLITLVKYIDDYRNHPIKLGHELYFSEGEISEGFVFNKILELKNEKIVLEASAWIGPH